MENSKRQQDVAEPVMVSVIIAFFNAEKFLADTVESVLAQTYKNWELLLVDDGSSDESTAIAKRFSGQFPQKIWYLEHRGHRNKGTCAARNLGVRNAKGKYIAILDGDDVWLPSKLEEQVVILEKNPDAGMLCGAVYYWRSWTGKDEDFNQDKTLQVGAPQDSLIYPPDLFFHLYPLNHGVAPTPSDLLLKRDVVVSIGGFEEKFNGKLQLYEDQAFLSKVYLNFPVYISSRCWIKYRLHPDSCISKVNKEGHYNFVRKFYLKWFEKYLIKRGCKGSAVWDLLQNILSPQRRPFLNNLKKKILRGRNSMVNAAKSIKRRLADLIFEQKCIPWFVIVRWKKLKSFIQYKLDGNGHE